MEIMDTNSLPNYELDGESSNIIYVMDGAL